MFPWSDLIAVLGDMDLDTVATIGPHVDPAELGKTPVNVRVERFVPQADLLKRSSAVVSHGGAGTVLGAAAHGLPQIVVPLLADQWENGVAVTEAGCGIALEPGGRSVNDFEHSLTALLASPSHRDAAARVAQGIQAMPGVEMLALEIEALAGS